MNTEKKDMAAKFPLIIVILLLFLFFFYGCTPEKARALLGAVKAFQMQANEAINAYEELLIEAVTQPERSPKEVVDDFVVQASDAIKQGIPISTEDVISKLDVKSIEERRKQKIQSELYEIRQYYDQFADSLASLPQASFTAVGKVGCTTEIAMRLVGQLINYASNLKQKPILPIVRISKLRAQFVSEAKKKTDQSKLVSIATQMQNLIKLGIEKNNEAIKLTLAAASQGQKVIELINNYGEVSVADILDVMNRGLAFAGSIKGIDINSTIIHLNSIKAKIENDPYWDRVKDLKVGEFGPACE